MKTNESPFWPSRRTNTVVVEARGVESSGEAAMKLYSMVRRERWFRSLSIRGEGKARTIQLTVDDVFGPQRIGLSTVWEGYPLAIVAQEGNRTA